jgi:hypothetical protein
MEWVEVSRDRQPEPACSDIMASNYLQLKIFFYFCTERSSEVSFIFIKKTDMSEVRNHLATRFANAKTIPGTRCFTTENESMISARTVSSDMKVFHFQFTSKVIFF